MKESVPNHDEQTGGLSGIANRFGGILPQAAAPGLTGVQAPKSLAGIRLRDGQAVGLELPSLHEREVVQAWRDRLGGGPLYVRCEERRRPLPIVQVQRLARMGELWLDCALAGEETAFDLLVAGAHRLVVWPAEQEDLDGVLESLGDSAVLGWDGSMPWAEAQELADGLPILCATEPPMPVPSDVPDPSSASPQAPAADLAESTAHAEALPERSEEAQPSDETADVGDATPAGPATDGIYRVDLTAQGLFEVRRLHEAGT